jgi:Leucine-rich repeat (LRR) protein
MEYSLELLDLMDNRISDITELRYISGLTNLKTLTIQSGQDTNPICEDRIEYFRAIMLLENIDSLSRIDKHSKSYI